MGKVISIEKLILQREAIKKLKENNIHYDEDKLKDHNDFCREIIGILAYLKELDRNNF